MFVLVLAFGVSMVLTVLLVRGSRRYAHHRLFDHDLSGPQKLHDAPVPRVGGIGIFVGACAAAFMLQWRDPALGRFALLLVACGVPAFASGLLSGDVRRRGRRGE